MYAAFMIGVVQAIIPCLLLFFFVTERPGVQCVFQAIVAGKSIFVVAGKLCLYLWRKSIHCCYDMQRPLIMTSEEFMFDKFLKRIWFLTAGLVLASCRSLLGQMWQCITTEARSHDINSGTFDGRSMFLI